MVQSNPKFHCISFGEGVDYVVMIKEGDCVAVVHPCGSEPFFKVFSPSPDPACWLWSISVG